MPERFLAASSTLPLRSRKNIAEAMAVGICCRRRYRSFSINLWDICAWLWPTFVPKANTSAEETIEKVEGPVACPQHMKVSTCVARKGLASKNSCQKVLQLRHTSFFPKPRAQKTVQLNRLATEL